MSHENHLRARQPQQCSYGASRPARLRHRRTMANVQDALDAVVAVGIGLT